MKTETIDGIEYSIGSMPTFDQFHVARRLAPFLSAVFTSAAAGISPSADDFDLLAMASPAVARVLAEMSNEDSEYILKTCLKVCRRHDGKGWASVLNTSGVMQYQDIGLRGMLTLVARVIREDLGDFFPTGQQASESVQE